MAQRTAGSLNLLIKLFIWISKRGLKFTLYTA